MSALAGRGRPLRAIVLAGGDAPARRDLHAAWPGWAEGLGFVVAADGGARHAGPLGLRVDVWVGDGDSLPEAEIAALAAAGARILRARTDKDETDAELAVLAAVEAGATDVTILGALGGLRLDHELANLALLAHPSLAGRSARILGQGGVRVSLIAAPTAGGEAVVRTLRGRPGDLVSLLPLFGRVDGVRTVGLQFRLEDEALEVGPARGVSNVRLGSEATVSVRNGRLLVVETPANLGP